MSLWQLMGDIKRNREREREKEWVLNLYMPYCFRKSSFWYLRDLNPGERNRERKK